MIAPGPSISDASSPGPPPVDLGLRIETPENVVLTYTLAGPTLRAGAYLIDFSIRAAVVFAAFTVVMCASAVTPGAAMGFFLLLLFVASWGYSTCFEAFWNGRTPGKWTVGLRVIQDKGYPITFWSAAGRNLVRAADSLGAPAHRLDRRVDLARGLRVPMPQRTPRPARVEGRPPG